MPTIPTKTIKYLISAALLTLLFSCGHQQTSSKPSPEAEQNNTNYEANGAIPQEHIGMDLNEFHHPDITKWLNFFKDRGNELFDRYLQNGQYYTEVVQTVLEDNGLPHEMFYLALIESGFKINAYSPKHASGIWQFISPTARRYGLSVTPYVDERRDPIRATEAASKYLRDLYNVFHSWPLAIASYNCGEIRVLRAIMKGKTRNFWELSEKKLLPRETREYVPKFFAAAKLGEFYRLQNKLPTNPALFPSVESLELPPRVDLRKLSKHLNMEFSTLKSLNPQLRTRYTPPQKDEYEIWLPSEKLALVKNKIQDLKPFVVTSKVFRNSHNYHRVKRGENLYLIAKRYKISIGRLKRINNLSKNSIFPGQKLRLSTPSYKNSGGGNFYFVKKGDSLFHIASQLGLSVKKLKSYNGMRSNRIYPGQKLKIGPSWSKIASSKHRVRRGETLAHIARRYGKSIRYLKNKNSLRNDRIYVGQVIKL